jgi:DNA-binding transcriptional MerR regulator
MDKREPSSIPEKLYYKIGEVSEITGIEPYVLRYWESEFKIVSPSRTHSKQRLYRKKDLELILENKRTEGSTAEAGASGKKISGSLDPGEKGTGRFARPFISGIIKRVDTRLSKW